MSIEGTKLKRIETGALVAAELDTLVGLVGLLEAEEQWAPWRVRVLRGFVEGDVEESKWPQHHHWSWAQKAVKLRKLDIESPLSPYRVMGMKCSDEWQGVVLVTSVGRHSRLGATGRELIYVDYLETAPWNLSIEAIGQSPRYTGVGRQLLEAAVRLSKAMEFRGRVGLHSLPQADSFYRRCGMTELGPDPQYSDLCYFEMSEKQAGAFLGEG